MATFEVTCPKCGETFLVEAPEKSKKTRGQLTGIALADMTDEQLKREIINANSVLYKAKQREVDDEKLAEYQARVDAAKAEKANRAPLVAKASNVEEALTGEAEEVYDSETAEEI